MSDTRGRRDAAGAREVLEARIKSDATNDAEKEILENARLYLEKSHAANSSEIELMCQRYLQQLGRLSPEPSTQLPNSDSYSSSTPEPWSPDSEPNSAKTSEPNSPEPRSIPLSLNTSIPITISSAIGQVFNNITSHYESRKPLYQLIDDINALAGTAKTSAPTIVNYSDALSTIAKDYHLLSNEKNAKKQSLSVASADELISLIYSFTPYSTEKSQIETQAFIHDINQHITYLKESPRYQANGLAQFCQIADGYYVSQNLSDDDYAQQLKQLYQNTPRTLRAEIENYPIEKDDINSLLLVQNDHDKHMRSLSATNTSLDLNQMHQDFCIELRDFKPMLTTYKQLHELSQLVAALPSVLQPLKSVKISPASIAGELAETLSNKTNNPFAADEKSPTILGTIKSLTHSYNKELSNTNDTITALEKILQALTALTRTTHLNNNLIEPLHHRIGGLIEWMKIAENTKEFSTKLLSIIEQPLHQLHKSFEKIHERKLHAFNTYMTEDNNEPLIEFHNAMQHWMDTYNKQMQDLAVKIEIQKHLVQTPKADKSVLEKEIKAEVAVYKTMQQQSEEKSYSQDELTLLQFTVNTLCQAEVKIKGFFGDKDFTKSIQPLKGLLEQAMNNPALSDNYRYAMYAQVKEKIDNYWSDLRANDVSETQYIARINADPNDKTYDFARVLGTIKLGLNTHVNLDDLEKDKKIIIPADNKVLQDLVNPAHLDENHIFKV